MKKIKKIEKLTNPEEFFGDNVSLNSLRQIFPKFNTLCEEDKKKGISVLAGAIEREGVYQVSIAGIDNEYHRFIKGVSKTAKSIVLYDMDIARELITEAGYAG